MLKSLFSAPLDTLKIPYSVHIKCIRRTLGNRLKSIPVIQSIMVHKRTQAVQLQIVMTSVGNRPELHNRLSVFINRLIINYLIGVGGKMASFTIQCIKTYFVVYLLLYT